MKVKFLKAARVNKGEYKKGDTINVSPSICKRLVDNGEAEIVETKSKSKNESESK